MILLSEQGRHVTAWFLLTGIFLPHAKEVGVRRRDQVVIIIMLIIIVKRNYDVSDVSRNTEEPGASNS